MQTQNIVKDTLALQRLADRIANQPKQIDNASLYAGSPMYFYCKLCGHLADKLPESYISPPKKYCTDCKQLKDANHEVTDATLVELAKA